MSSEIYERVDALEQENSELKQEIKELRELVEKLDQRLTEHLEPVTAAGDQNYE